VKTAVFFVKDQSTHSHSRVRGKQVAAWLGVWHVRSQQLGFALF